VKPIAAAALPMRLVLTLVADMVPFFQLTVPTWPETVSHAFVKPIPWFSSSLAAATVVPFGRVAVWCAGDATIMDNWVMAPSRLARGRPGLLE